MLYKGYSDVYYRIYYVPYLITFIALWFVALRNLLGCCQRFGETYCGLLVCGTA
jgi:hypothetical protein